MPAVLGPAGTALAFDLRRVGWDNARVWSRILAEYLYGLKFKNVQDRDFRAVAEEVESLIGRDAGLAEVRADWFLDNAGRPPLYHAILKIPATAAELEKSLGVDVEADFASDTLRRAGFARSGVSKQNRMVDRHDADSGYYWKSYDFRKDGPAANLFHFPLGPAFAANAYPAQAFAQAGGEIVFSLPNRLNGYMLVDAKGGRIDQGPPDVVFDSRDAAGTSTIVNGISCMGCHKNGIVTAVQDHIREGATVADAARRKVEQLVPPRAEMARLLRGDEARFLAALEEAVGPFLRDEPGAEATRTRDLPEPIVPIAKIHQADLDLAAVAAELNLESAQALRTLIRADARLRAMGLADLLVDGGAIDRAEWATAGDGTSTYQRVSSEIDRGLPVIVPRRED